MVYYKKSWVSLDRIHFHLLTVFICDKSTVFICDKSSILTTYVGIPYPISKKIKMKKGLLFSLFLANSFVSYIPRNKYTNWIFLNVLFSLIIKNGLLKNIVGYPSGQGYSLSPL